MALDLKRIVRELLNFLHIDLSLNLKYDRLTKVILGRVLLSDSCCIDIGCHKGEILDMMLKHSPGGQHFGFEPIPELFGVLQAKYKNRCNILPFAISDFEGKSTFNFVRNAPAYSGIKKRTYDIPEPEIDEIEIEVRRLDNVIPENIEIRFIKIDVEGGEFDVLKGGRKLISRCRPFILFEFGLGASDHYGTKPEDIYNLIVTELSLQISNLAGWLKGKQPLSLEEFSNVYLSRKEYYFLAHP